MARPNEIANEDLAELYRDLKSLELVMTAPPTAQASAVPATASKDELIEKIDQDLLKVVSSVFIQAEHSNFRIPASKASRDLYAKLKEISGRDDLTEDDLNEVDSLLKRLLRQIDPEHPYVAEPEKDKSQGMSVGVPDDRPKRYRSTLFTRPNDDDDIHDAVLYQMDEDEVSVQEDEPIGDDDDDAAM
ncbi:hypothetical protein FLONG3_1331 [Fusarium longipes]|uniref:Uncharacterized protein n=1 Tax=Fusarium longipes TaxID=694270 RepID=A0A395T7L2_9HYPO|nr:hypothetical protein FLONG3_1331 [Fusarium longipes]